jgi:hypothetical protein
LFIFTTHKQLVGTKILAFSGMSFANVFFGASPAIYFRRKVMEPQFGENEFKSGRTVVTVKASSRADEARAILRGAGAYDIETHPAYHA